MLNLLKQLGIVRKEGEGMGTGYKTLLGLIVPSHPKRLWFSGYFLGPRIELFDECTSSAFDTDCLVITVGENTVRVVVFENEGWNEET